MHRLLFSLFLIGCLNIQGLLYAQINFEMLPPFQANLRTSSCRHANPTIKPTPLLYVLLERVFTLFPDDGVAFEKPPFEVALQVPRWVLRGSSTSLRCEHTVAPEALHKVEWLKGRQRLFQYIRDRTPAYRHYPVQGATIDMQHSDHRQIVLRDLDFEATGLYSCQVSSLYPIFTRASNDEELIIYQDQTSPPDVSVPKEWYVVGEPLTANCTPAPSWPPATVTWLLNGNPVPKKFVHHLSGSSSSSFPAFDLTDSHEADFFDEDSSSSSFADNLVIGSPILASAQPTSFSVQLNLDALPEKLVGEMTVTCLATIPEYKGEYAEPEHYADHRAQTVAVMVSAPEPPVVAPLPAAAAGAAVTASVSSSAEFVQCQDGPIVVLLPLLVLLR